MKGTPSSPTPSDPYLQSLLAHARQDLAGLLGLAEEEIELVELQPVTWPDGSLGCPQPGMAYTQVQVDGLRILLRAAGQVYHYHSGGSRQPFLCENPQ